MDDLPEQGVSHNARIRKRQILTNGEVGPVTNYARATFPPGDTELDVTYFGVISGRL